MQPGPAGHAISLSFTVISEKPCGLAQHLNRRGERKSRLEINTTWKSEVKKTCMKKSHPLTGQMT